MSNNLYMAFHPGDYLTDTAHLTTLEHGAYLLLIMNYWQRGGALPADERKLRGISRMTADEWADSRGVLLEFFSEDGGMLHHKRIDAELDRARTKSSKAKASAEHSVNVRRANAERTLGERSANQDQDQVQETADAVSPPEPREVSLEAKCRMAVGQEPVLLALDFHVLADAVERGDYTEPDVLAGIAAAMAEPNFRIRNWKQLDGWVRRAAKDRLGGAQKALGPRQRTGPPPVMPASEKAAHARPGQRYAKGDSDEWAIGAEMYHREHRKYPPRDTAGGWWFPESYFVNAQEGAAA